MVLALTAQLALAAVARVVPRLSTFSLAFGVVLGCALLATLAEVPEILPAAGRPWIDISRLGAR